VFIYATEINLTTVEKGRSILFLTITLTLYCITDRVILWKECNTIFISCNWLMEAIILDAPKTGFLLLGWENK
jgi:hypothetical protein